MIKYYISIVTVQGAGTEARTAAVTYFPLYGERRVTSRERRVRLCRQAGGGKEA